MKNKQFQQFKTSANEDGSINILKVPIFELGEHKGIDFNNELIDEVIGNHQSHKEEKDYRSSVIIGHNKDDQEEKEAEGLMDNLALEDNLVYSDIINVDADTFEKKIKKGKYPHRSVEFNPKTKMFTALALLGGTTPHHKLPIMEFKDDEDHIRLDFEYVDLEGAIETDDKLQKLRDLWWKMWNFIDKVAYDPDKDEGEKQTEIKSLLEQGTELLGKKVNTFKEDKSMKFTDEQKKELYAERDAQIKETFGKTPEELAAENTQFQESQAQAKTDAKKESIKAFAEKLKDAKGMRLAPALVDDLIIPFMESIPDEQPFIKFKEDDKDVEVPQMTFFQSLIEKAVTMAADNKLQVPFDEETEGVEFESESGEHNLDKIDKKATEMAKKFQEDGKYKSSEEAYEAAVDTIYEKL